jgi:hypothetical protein
MSDQDKRHLWNGKEPSYYVTGHAPQTAAAALPDVPEHCVICGSSEPFAGSCGGGRLNNLDNAAVWDMEIGTKLIPLPEKS